MKNLALLFFLSIISSSLFCQSACDTLNELINDNFDDYVEGTVSNQSEFWSTFSGLEGGEEEGVVSSLVVNSGSNSLAFGDAYGSSSQNALFNFGEITEGMAIIEFSIYVVPFFSALIAGQQSSTIPNEELSFALNFGTDGIGNLKAGGEDLTQFSYDQEQWLDVRFVFDLDNDFVTLSVDNDFIFGWPISWTIGGQSGSKSISSLLFQTLSLEELYFIDDVRLNSSGSAVTGKFCHLATNIDVGTHTVGTFECYGAGFTVRDDGEGLKGEWYSYTPSTDGIITLGSCNGGVDTRVWIFSGGCEILNLEGVNDDQCLVNPEDEDDYASYREVVVKANETYYIVWDNVWEDGNFDFELGFSDADLVPGNFCESAIPIENGEVEIEVIDGHGSVSGPDINHTSASTTNYAKSEWYTYTPESDGFIKIASCFFTEEDTRLWVYKGTCGIENLELIASDDDGCELQSIILDFPVEAGIQYFFEWDNEDLESVGFTFLFEFELASAVQNLLTENEHILVYPNPSSGNITIDFQLESAKDIQITLFNSIGKVVSNQKIKASVNDRTMLKMHELEQGIYYIKFDDGERRMVQRMVKN